MSDHIWKLGQIYRDTASKSSPDDQLLRWLIKSDGMSINNSTGIRSLGFVPGVQCTEPFASLIFVASDLENPAAGYWIDPLPDFENGRMQYWGDAKVEQSGQRRAEGWQGNKLLLITRKHGVTGRYPAVPIVLFSKTAVGQVQFLGLGVLSSAEVREQYQSGGVPVSNVLATVNILDCREVDAEWLTRRASEGPGVDAELAPDAWKMVLNGVLNTISLSGQEISDLGLPKPPATAVDAFKLLSPNDIVTAIERFNNGERSDFGPSTQYDLLFEGKRYPPKAICGLACKRILGRDATHAEFTGGVGSPCFRTLERLGFEIQPKPEELVPSDGILLTWNREKWPWHDLQEHIELIRAGRSAEAAEVIGSRTWSVGNRKDIPKGTPFYMIKLGQNPKGIIGSGSTASEVFQDDHFDAQKASEGVQANYVELIWDTLIDPLKEGAMDVWSMDEPEISSMRWSSQQSGITIPAPTIEVLEPRWQDYLASLNLNVPEEPTPLSPYSLADLQSELFMPDEDVPAMVNSLQRRKNVVLQGPPGVGKSFMARKLAYALIGAKADDQVEMIQFHQAYAYEDFIQGYRPAEDGFTRADGVFYRFCRRAAELPAIPFVFVIDEINRGNLSAILGEVMLLIERDKRGKLYQIPLTYSSENDPPEKYCFYVPENVHLLGLMNTADRSLAMVDYALRRRFRFFNIWPQFNHKFRNHLLTLGCADSLCDRIITSMEMLNKQITEDSDSLGRGYQIGHSYFCPENGEVPDENWYETVVRESIVPLLDEYWFDDPDRVAEAEQELLD